MRKPSSVECIIILLILSMLVLLVLAIPSKSAPNIAIPAPKLRRPLQMIKLLCRDSKTVISIKEIGTDVQITISNLPGGK